jgi:signal transduction histidine kinase
LATDARTGAAASRSTADAPAPRGPTVSLPYVAAGLACLAGLLGLSAFLPLAPRIALAAAVALALVAAWPRLVHGRRWQRRLTGQLASQAAFLDQLAAALASVSSTLERQRVLERAAAEAHRLLDADATVLLVADGLTLRPAAASGIALGPYAALQLRLDAASSLPAEVARSRRAATADNPVGDAFLERLRPASALALPLVALDELQAVVVLARLAPERPLGASELSLASVFADLAGRVLANALLFERVEALLAQAQMREAERAELSRRLVSAEQDERRRLSLALHDGPLQTLAGVAMMLDAATEGIEADPAATRRVLETARQRQRGVVRSLRELSFALEPWALRDQGFGAAVGALADEVERLHEIRVSVDAASAEELDPDRQVLLYQIVREAVQNAVKHAAPRHIEIAVRPLDDGRTEALVADDGRGVDPLGPRDGLPHHGMASMRERAAVLDAPLEVRSTPGRGTQIRLVLRHAEARDAA